MSFQEYCSELQRRLPFPISGFALVNRAVIGMNDDPDRVTWNCALDLQALIEVETALAARAVALKVVTVH